MEEKKRVTFDDIARYTNFSKTTISRYFNDPDSLTEKSQQIISEALEKLDYHENRVARILAMGKTEFIGVIVPEFYHRFYSEVLNQILATYETFGYKFLVFIGNNNKESECRYIKELLSYQIEGMIVLSHTLSSQELAQFQIPVVAIEREDQYVCSVNTDNEAGGRQAAALLEEQQCDVLIHINSPTDPRIPAYGRIRGFEDYCQANGLAHEVVLRDLDRSYEEDQVILKDILQEWDKKYARKKIGVFLANDTTANTLLNLIIRRYGYLPKEYCIVGFDNSPTSREAIIPLSTVGQQVDRLAHEAVSLLVDQIKARKQGKTPGESAPVHKIVPPVLFRRATAGGVDVI
ncbi:LacI family DNA-binding transcriptional regulator [Flavonifractor sp. AGMB03687]|uniref:LacI family DNA-binding transcriptional regulator n=1 Tax=Flavonifractor sp. AGMB03687 TaxID=2785133 RepID=UPI001ADF461B|nr:LacI family DNA-binding transcriptional regulator [Flavonifractor sp. AGMB03687]